MLHTKFGVNWPFGSGDEVKNRFSRWRPWQPSWIFDRNDFSYFGSTVTPMLPTKFRVNWHFGLGEELKNRFSRRFFIYKTPQCLLPCFESTCFSVQENKQKKIDFQDGCHGGHLGFLIGTILATFDLQVTPMQV